MKCRICEKEFDAWTRTDKLGRVYYEKTFCSKECKSKNYTLRYREKYGNGPSRSQESIKASQEKTRQTLLNRYQVTNPGQLSQTIEAHKGNKELYKKIAQNNQQKYGVTNTFQLPHARQSAAKNNGKIVSKINKEWQVYLKEQLGLDFKFEVNGFDLFYENAHIKLALEINPTISHNSTYSYSFITGLEKENNPISPDYHYNKYLKAKQLGYFLISVFDWYDREKIVDLIKSKLKILPNRIYARKCEIKEIADNKLVRAFLNENHLQNWTNSSIKLGLFYNDELLQIATFGRPRRNKNYQWELIRICSKKDWLIVGGESKLTSFFRQNYTAPKDKIMSYENLDISQKDGRRSPSYGIWINKEGRIISCTSVLMRGASRMIGDSNFEKYPYGKYNNEEIMIREGYVKVYNCGNVIVEI